MYKIVCICGMPGAGKSLLSDYFASNGYKFVRFGQVVIDEILRRNLEPSEKNQKSIRGEIRKKYGMAGVAKLNLPKLRKLLKSGNVVADGLYSWSEYKLLKKVFAKQMINVAVFAPPALRYERLAKRIPGINDKKLRNHHFSKSEAKKRDFAEIENIEKGGPIAMADYTIVNASTKTNFIQQIEELYKKVSAK